MFLTLADLGSSGTLATDSVGGQRGDNWRGLLASDLSEAPLDARQKCPRQPRQNKSIDAVSTALPPTKPRYQVTEERNAPTESPTVQTGIRPDQGITSDDRKQAQSQQRRDLKAEDPAPSNAPAGG